MKCSGKKVKTALSECMLLKGMCSKEVKIALGQRFVPHCNNYIQSVEKRITSRKFVIYCSMEVDESLRDETNSVNLQ